MKPILSETSTFRNFDGGPEFAEHAIYARFALQLSFLLCLHPRLQRLRGPTVWDTFHGSLDSHKCNSSCLTSDTVCVASATKEIDALLKNKWSVGNIYMVISSLIVYLFENSVKFLFKFCLFHGVGLLISYPPKKFVEIGQRTSKLRMFYDIGLLFMLVLHCRSHFS